MADELEPKLWDNAKVLENTDLLSSLLEQDTAQNSPDKVKISEYGQNKDVSESIAKTLLSRPSTLSKPCVDTQLSSSNVEDFERDSLKNLVDKEDFGKFEDKGANGVKSPASARENTSRNSGKYHQREDSSKSAVVDKIDEGRRRHQGPSSGASDAGADELCGHQLDERDGEDKNDGRKTGEISNGQKTGEISNGRNTGEISNGQKTGEISNGQKTEERRKKQPSRLISEFDSDVAGGGQQGKQQGREVCLMRGATRLDAPGNCRSLANERGKRTNEQLPAEKFLSSPLATSALFPPSFPTNQGKRTNHTGFPEVSYRRGVQNATSHSSKLEQLFAQGSTQSGTDFTALTTSQAISHRPFFGSEAYPINRQLRKPHLARPKTLANSASGMETLTESGVMPHAHYPMSVGGYYSKQEHSPYYYPGSNRPPTQGYGPYPNYPPTSDGETRMNAQSGAFDPHQRYPSGGDDRRDERGTGSGSGAYYPPFQQQHQASPHPHTSPYQRQMHPSPHHTSQSSSLPPYHARHSSPSSKEKGPTGADSKVEDGAVVDDPISKMDSSFTPEKSNNIRSPSDRHSFIGSKNNSTAENIHNAQLYYNKRNSRYMGENRFSHQDYPELPHGVKDVPSNIYDNNGRINNYLSGKSEAVPSVQEEDKTLHAEGRLKGMMSAEYREKLERSVSHESSEALMMGRDFRGNGDGRPNRSMAIDSSLYRKEGPHSMYNYGSKVEVVHSKMQDSMNQSVAASQVFQAEKLAPVWDDMPPHLRPAGIGQRSAGSDSDQRQSRQGLPDRHAMTPRDRYDMALAQRQNEMMSALEAQQRRGSADGRRSPNRPENDHEFRSSGQSSSRYQSSSPAKSSSVPPPGEHRNNAGTLPPHPWGSLAPSTSAPPRVKHPQDETSDDSKERFLTKGDKTTTPERRSSPSRDGSFIAPPNEFSSPSKTSNPHPGTQYLPFVSPGGEALPNKTPPQRALPEDDAKKESNQNDSGVNHWNDGSLVAKREVFSDEGGDDNTFQGSRPRSPMTPPSPDAASTYPPHFPHPFFASPGRGMHPAHGVPVGPPRDHPAIASPAGRGFPFGQELAGRFPLPGLTPEMALGGHIHPNNPPFMGQGPAALGQVRARNEDKDIFFCHLCNYSGKSKPNFDTHMNIHFEYNCPHCDYTSRTEGRLRRHIKDFHSEDSTRRSMPGRPKIYKCKTCSFQATEKDEFWAHARIHIKDEKMLQCPKCPFVTEYKHHLEYHLRNHFGSKPFKCNKCNYSCVNKSMLNSHMKSHTNVYQYRCSDCTYATKYCHSLKLHLKKYNHKPATVLNQDGSLPQGLDAESSGLTIAAKRGPPRGPRGPRKDKNDPYFGQLFGVPNMPQVPLGMNPMLNGMMPFWPLLPHAGMGGHPSPQPGMLPGIGNLARHMARGEENSDSRDCSGMEGSGGNFNENSSEGSLSQMKEEDVACKLCNFVGETTEALCLHFVQVHKDEAKEVAKAYGISEASMIESMSKGRPEMLMERRRMSEPPRQSQRDSDSEFHHRNTIAGLLSRENPGSLQIQTDQNVERSQAPPASWPPSTFSDSSRGGNRIYGVCYPEMNNETEEENTEGPSEGMDILQQMTLKFGNGVLPEKTNSKDEHEMHPKDTLQDTENRQGHPPRANQKETPLDLTKPKSVSPPMFSDRGSPKPEDNIDDDDDNRYGQSDESKSLSRVTELLLKKRPYPEVGETSTTESSAIVPRKRSRKGKAYKLDTLCLKLQERQTDSPVDDDGYDSQINLETFQPLQSVMDNEDDVQETQESKDKINNEGDETEDMEKQDASERKSEISNNIPESGAEFDKEIKSDSEDTMDYEDKRIEDLEEPTDKRMDKTFKREDDIPYPQNERNEESLSHEQSTKTEESFTDEAEYELAKLQRTLGILDKGFDPETEKSESDMKQKGNEEVQERCKVTNENPDNDETVQNYGKDTKREQALSDKENSNDITSPKGYSSQMSTDGDEVEQVEMINTVLENRKKPLPAAVRRGTELAWKLLHDPVNPVTSLPLPVNPSPPPSQPKISPHPSTSTSSLTSTPGGNTPLRNGMRLPPMLPPIHSHAHLAGHVPPPPMSMNPPMPIPLPPTPMAYIPQTNRIMPEPLGAPPSSSNTTSSRDMYQCTYCDVKFGDCVMYTVHMGYHSNRNPFQCNSCGQVCQDKVDFFLHMARSAHA